jgi:hypothetical protein
MSEWFEVLLEYLQRFAFWDVMETRLYTRHVGLVFKG